MYACVCVTVCVCLCTCKWYIARMLSYMCGRDIIWSAKYCSMWCAGIIGGCLSGTRVVVFSVGQFQIHKVMFVFSPHNHPSEFSFAYLLDAYCIFTHTYMYMYIHY